MVTDNPTIEWSDSQITVLIPGNTITITAGKGQHQYTIGLDGMDEPFAKYRRVTESLFKKVKRWWEQVRPDLAQNERVDSDDNGKPSD